MTYSKFNQDTVRVGDIIRSSLSNFDVPVTEVLENYVKAQNKFGSGQVRGWRRVAYNKITRNLTADLRDAIDELVEL